MLALTLGVVGAVVFAIYCTIGYRRYSRGHRGRKWQLLMREPLEPNEWFERYAPIPPRQRAAVVEVLEALGEEVDAGWTHLRPGDTFSRTLSVNEGLWSLDDLSSFELYLSNWCDRHGLSPDGLDPFPDRVEDFVSCLAQLLEESTDVEGGQLA
jgi:hypothetical protein